MLQFWSAQKILTTLTAGSSRMKKKYCPWRGNANILKLDFLPPHGQAQELCPMWIWYCWRSAAALHVPSPGPCSSCHRNLSSLSVDGLGHARPTVPRLAGQAQPLMRVTRGRAYAAGVEMQSVPTTSGPWSHYTRCPKLVLHPLLVTLAEFRIHLLKMPWNLLPPKVLAG